MNEDCLFCKIVRKEINAKEVLRDEHELIAEIVDVAHLAAATGVTGNVAL